MSTRLERLIDSISPEITIKPAYELVNEAVNSFEFPDVMVDSFDGFIYLMVCLHRHLEAAVLRVDSMPGSTVDFHWNRVCNVLRRIYGSTGEKAAFEMVRTNKQGGLRKVVNRFAAAAAYSFAENEIEAKINRYINSLSAGERLAAGDEYIRRFGYLLPSEMLEAGAARIHDNLARVLKQHAIMLESLEYNAQRF
jgi:hypothetical protein